ncbi:nucleo TPR [Olea europaea subsp. europaea]|uniref:Nucleo TPR n=2 Tax=Olea europaea subsp. europaea TaxID=158383 RepID=A0A8S0RFB8_OLEEU|nr:nucleo TPR [Olea europaea subsp. europaea]
MLEKIGLPPKPSLRGNNWVTDASHCQGCSAQFNFINRKHHCRRCGGIFCNSCTQLRMVLRGQGDSAVRICEPCKKLEEAARFEMRHGHKTRAGRGGSKLASKKEDEILNQILGDEDMLSDPQLTSSASCSNVKETSTKNGGDIGRSTSFDQPAQALTEVGSATPEDLRQQALVEKKKYRTLKAEGKSEEALRAFKWGKELERQAGALEVYLRKRRRMVSSSSSTNDIQQIRDDSISSGENNKFPIQKSKEKDDLAAELKELGWSDFDLLDSEKRPAVKSLEGEFSSLLEEIPQKPNKEKGVVATDKSQVIAHKKKALELKHEGKLAEAKEELKRAKILERKIEEEEFLGEAEDSDDELSALIRSMDDDKHDDLSAQYKHDINFDFDNLVGVADDVAVDGIFEVTDEDMGDPEIASALKSLGWTEDSTYTEDSGIKVGPLNRESLLTEVQSLKRKALNQKKAGNTREALALLKKAKVLEVELQRSDSHGTEVSDSQSAEEPFIPIKLAAENVNDRKDTGRNSAPKSKLMIQKELIALKKKVLSLKREGKLDEAEEELKNAKVLEEQFEELNKAPTVKHPSTNSKQTSNATTIDLENEAEVTDVTDHDMNDPSYLSLLKNLGWEEDNNENVPSTSSNENKSASKYPGHSSVAQATANLETGTSRKSKSDIQRELLGLKRKALTLRRQGEVEEADEVLKMARLLEVQLQEFEVPIQKEVLDENSEGNASMDASQNAISLLQVDSSSSLTEDLGSKNKITVEKPEVVSESVLPHILEPTSTQATISQHESSSFEQDILAHKRKAITLKREGKLVEAKEELRQAKLLEKHLEDRSHPNTSSSDTSSSDVSSVEKKEASPKSVSKPLSGRDRFKLQQESLGHKRQALKLRREGRTEEADAEFELAKALESQLQELDAHGNSGTSENAESVDGVSVEDFLDPQLLSALNSIGLEATRTKSQNIERPELNKSAAVSNGDANEEREQLVERIKAEKVKAVNLKRSGKQAEALDALRKAKLYEKKLQSLTTRS